VESQRESPGQLCGSDTGEGEATLHPGDQRRRWWSIRVGGYRSSYRGDASGRGAEGRYPLRGGWLTGCPRDETGEGVVVEWALLLDPTADSDGVVQLGQGGLLYARAASDHHGHPVPGSSGERPQGGVGESMGVVDEQQGTLRAGRSDRLSHRCGAGPQRQAASGGGELLQPVGTPGTVYAHHHDHRVISSHVWSLVSLGDRCRECPPSPGRRPTQTGGAGHRPAPPGCPTIGYLRARAKPTPRAINPRMKIKPPTMTLF